MTAFETPQDINTTDIVHGGLLTQDPVEAAARRDEDIANYELPRLSGKLSAGALNATARESGIEIVSASEEPREALEPGQIGYSPTRQAYPPVIK